MKSKPRRALTLFDQILPMEGMEDIAYNNCKIIHSKLDELHLKYIYIDKLTLIEVGKHD